MTYMSLTDRAPVNGVVTSVNGDGLKEITFKYRWQRAFRYRARLTMPAGAVAAQLCCWADGDGMNIKPGNDRLARALGRPGKPAHPGTIAKAINELTSDRWLVLIKDRGRGRGMAAEYALRIPKGPCECRKFPCICGSAGGYPKGVTS